MLTSCQNSVIMSVIGIQVDEDDMNDIDIDDHYQDYACGSFKKLK